MLLIMFSAWVLVILGLLIYISIIDAKIYNGGKCPTCNTQWIIVCDEDGNGYHCSKCHKTIHTIMAGFKA